jgi:phage terminase large subunit
MRAYVPRGAFLEFHNRRQRWATLCTHRRAGKTVALVNDIIVGALECQGYRPQLAYVGPTYKQAKRTAWQYMKDYGEQWFAAPPSEAELKITLHGDRVVYCLGADNPDSLRGMYLDGAMLDEYALFKPSVFSTIVRPALSDRLGWCVFASTPRGKNLFFDQYKLAVKNPESHYLLHLSAEKSGIIHPAELEELRKDMDPEEFAQEYMCSFDAAIKGAIYAAELNQVFFDDRVKPNIYDSNLPVHVVFDLGFTDATVAIFWQEDPDGLIRVVAVLATQGQSIQFHIEQLHQFPGQLGDIWLPHDARARNLQTGRSLVEQFLAEDIRPKLVPNHKVRDRLSATRKLFPRIVFQQGDTDDLVEALKGYRRRFDEDLKSYIETPLHDWCSDYADAFGYMCVVASTGRNKTILDTKSVDMLELPSGYNLHNLWIDQKHRRSLTGRRIA